jgi:hypothetical protein
MADYVYERGQKAVAKATELGFIMWLEPGNSIPLYRNGRETATYVAAYCSLGQTRATVYNENAPRFRAAKVTPPMPML